VALHSCFPITSGCGAIPNAPVPGLGPPYEAQRAQEPANRRPPASPPPIPFEALRGGREEGQRVGLSKERPSEVATSQLGGSWTPSATGVIERLRLAPPVTPRHRVEFGVVANVPRETSRPGSEEGAFTGYPVPTGKSLRTAFRLAEHLVAEMSTNEICWLQSQLSQLSGWPPIQVVFHFGLDSGPGNVVSAGRGLRDDEPATDTEQGSCAFGHDGWDPERAHHDTIE
jgi:hypothetical protein